MFDGFIESSCSTGGPAMWILLVLSVVAIAIVIERLLFFSSQHSDSEGPAACAGTEDRRE